MCDEKVCDCGCDGDCGVLCRCKCDHPVWDEGICAVCGITAFEWNNKKGDK